MKIIFGIKHAKKMTEIEVLATKDGSMPEHLPMDSKWNLERTFLNYDYSQDIKSEQITKLIKVYKKFQLETYYCNPYDYSDNTENENRDESKIYENTRLADWSITWLQYAYLKVQHQRSSKK